MAGTQYRYINDTSNNIMTNIHTNSIWEEYRKGANGTTLM